MKTLLRGSSEPVERTLLKGEDAGSNPAPGATTYLYVIVRRELTGGALLAHVGHAAREAPGPRPSEDERICVLVATKAEMADACQRLDAAGIPYKACVETDGPMAGSTPSVGLAGADRVRIKEALGHLKVWRPA